MVVVVEVVVVVVSAVRVMAAANDRVVQSACKDWTWCAGNKQRPLEKRGKLAGHAIDGFVYGWFQCAAAERADQ